MKLDNNKLKTSFLTNMVQSCNIIIYIVLYECCIFKCLVNFCHVFISLFNQLFPTIFLQSICDVPAILQIIILLKVNSHLSTIRHMVLRQTTIIPTIYIYKSIIACI